MNYIFGMQVDGITLGLGSQVCSKYPKKTSFVLPLQYLKESIKDEVDFLPAYKPQRFLQIDTIILGTCGQSWPNHPK